MPEWIHDLSCWIRGALPNPEGSGSSAEWWAAAGALLAAVGGIVAVGFTGLQLRLSRQAMEAASREALVSRDLAERARKSAIRPVLSIPKVAVLPGGTLSFLEVTLRNDGSGPAVNVRVRATAFHIPDEVFKERLTELGPWRNQLESSGAIQPFRLLWDLQTLASGRDQVGYLLRDEAPQALHDVGAPALVYLSVVFDDLDGTEFHYPEDSAPEKLAFIWKFGREENRLPELV